MHKGKKVKEIYPRINIKNNEVVFDQNGTIVAWLFKRIIPEKLIKTLNKSASKCKLGSLLNDMRGSYKTAVFGSLIERGGSGRIHLQQHTTAEGKKFIKKNKKLIQLVSSMMSQITTTQSFVVDYIPTKFKQFGKFSTIFWNRTPISISVYL